MTESNTHEADRGRAAGDCGVRLAPLYVAHTLLLAMAVIWMIVVLAG